MSNCTPTVSVFMLAYNHEEYIAQAIEGILMQKVNFYYEIVIGEDCSTDNTLQIIINYANKNPKRFKLILHEKNVGAAANQIAVLKACSGKYIALCEGDDYWTDPYKLQKQVDFLETNLEYGLVHTNHDILYQKSGNVDKGVKSDKDYENFKNTFFGILTGDYEIATCTVLAKRELLLGDRDNDIIPQQENLQGDLPRWLSIAQSSKIKYINDSTAVYRKNFGSVRRSGIKKKEIEFQESSKRIRMQFARKYMVPKEIMERVEDMYYYVMVTKGYHLNKKQMVQDAYHQMHKKNINIILKYLSIRFRILSYIISIIRYLRKVILMSILVLRGKRV